jgi:hypothetical protein
MFADLIWELFLLQNRKNDYKLFEHPKEGLCFYFAVRQSFGEVVC